MLPEEATCDVALQRCHLGSASCLLLSITASTSPHHGWGAAEGRASSSKAACGAVILVFCVSLRSAQYTHICVFPWPGFPAASPGQRSGGSG